MIRQDFSEYKIGLNLISPGDLSSPSGPSRVTPTHESQSDLLENDPLLYMHHEGLLITPISK